MGKILVVAEKPSVGRDISRVLKAEKKENGYNYGEKYVVSWAIGHLIALCDPEDYDQRLKKWRAEDLPIIPQKMKLKAINETKEQLKILKRLMNSSRIDSIICATDSGREGELIFRYIYEYVNCHKPFERLWISSMTDKAIKNGFENLKPSNEYDRLYKCAKCRSEADWLVGMNASRAYTLKYNSLLSIGRVQSPTLNIIVERKKEIEAFESKEYYEVVADYESFKGTWFLEKYSETKIFDKEKALEIAKKVSKKTGVVEKIEDEENRVPPPLLYDLTELQRDCNKKFGFSAKKTLSIAQSLYEKRKMITYPRTDSRYLSDDMAPKVGIVLKKLNNLEDYKHVLKPVLEMKKLPFSKRIIDNSKVTDHHAIIPAECNFNVQKLTSDEREVFNVIALRFISVFYAHHVFNVTRVVVNCMNERFVSKGTTVISPGWTAIYGDSENDSETPLPHVAEGENIDIVLAKAVKKKTSPPKPYTEAGLLSAMENAGRFIDDEEMKEMLKDGGIGTPATRASIIERLIEVGYVTRKGKTLLPTEKGEKLIEVLPNELKSPLTTGKWEKGLASIEKGNINEEKFMESICRFVHFLIEDSGKESGVVFEEENRSRNKGGLGKCPKCGKGNVFENSKAFFCGNWKNGCKFTIWKDSLKIYGYNIDSKTIKKLLKNKKVEGIECTLPQTGERGKADIVYNENTNGGIELINLKRM
ncbi:MAG: DNA topoisomerase III [Firmicutes bacterium]|nr:DNA topoisomerase III [Bacillota bacterium]